MSRSSTGVASRYQYVLATDAPQIDTETGHVVSDGLPVRWAGLKGTDSEGVPQIVESHARRTGWSTISELPGQSDEHDVGAHALPSRIVGRCPWPRASRGGRDRLRRVDGCKAISRCLPAAVADDQAILDQIFAL